MKLSLSLDNFRKFKHLDSLDCSEITFLVGPNGSGKSSFTKALLLEISNFNRFASPDPQEEDGNSFPIFRFDSIKYGDMHIDRFSRALYNCADNDQISLILSTHGKSGITNTYGMTIKKSSTNKDTAVISKIEICSRIKGSVKFVIDYESATYSIIFFDENDNQLYEKKEQRETRSALDVAFHVIGGVPEAIVNKVIGTSLIGGAAMAALASIPFLGAVVGAGAALGLDFFSKKKETKQNKNTDDNLPYEIAPALYALTQIQIDYVYAHYVEQNFLFGGENHDYLSNTIVEFYSLGCMKRARTMSFIKKWMDNDHFKIGDSFDIRESEFPNTYYFDIIENEQRIPLADKGVGQIQIMILLMRIGIANTIYENRNLSIRDFKVGVGSPLIIIEEPEQNMHPNMQSKLADLFKDAHDRFGIRFLIETHSEYIVRRSQVLVSQLYKNDPEEFLTNNIFKVIYFPEDGQPYDMQFKQNGFFVRSFKPGFIDEAGKWQMELLTK